MVKPKPPKNKKPRRNVNPVAKAASKMSNKVIPNKKKDNPKITYDSQPLFSGD